MNMFEKACAEMAERTGLTGRELKAATYDDIAESCEAAERKDPNVPSGTAAIYLYREMARKTRAGEIN